MWGWKAVERLINPAVPIDEACAIAIHNDFEEHIRNANHVIFKRSGSQVTASVKELPLELAIAVSDEGLYIQLRYDAFVLFDTGDLDRLADNFASKMKKNSQV